MSSYVQTLTLVLLLTFALTPRRLKVLHTPLHAEAEQKESSVHLPAV